VIDQRLHLRAALEHRLAGEQEVGDAAERVDVGAMVHLLVADDHFGGHERGRADDPFERCERLRQVVRRPGAGHLDEAEVEDLDKVVLQSHSADEDVGGLDVAVHHPAAMSLGQRMTDLPQQVDHAGRRQGPELSDERGHVASGQELHHVVEAAVIGDAEVEQPDRVRRREGGRRLGLALESPQRGAGFGNGATRQHPGVSA
jgi:hypothetical protein